MKSTTFSDITVKINTYFAEKITQADTTATVYWR